MVDHQQCRDTLERYVKARIPFVLMQTQERPRAIELLRDVATSVNIPIFAHTLSQGVRDLTDNRVVNDDQSVFGALEFASQQISQRQHFTLAFTDVPDIEGDSAMSRQLYDVATLASQRGGQVIVIGNTQVWSPVQRMGMSVTLDTPNEDEMYEVIRANVEPYKMQIPIEWGEAEYRQAASVLYGLTEVEAENAISTLLAKGNVTADDLVELTQTKDRIFNDISGLERIAVDESLNAIGGLEGLRSWLAGQGQLLTSDLRERGMRPPRGVLLVGVPGCGKSLSAKAVAVWWQLALYRLDMANIQGMYVGQSEARLKEALSTADHLAPCVLWIDEIEKGLAGAGTESTGVTSRLVGHFLFWLQESRQRVFVVATANDVSKLPPELLRRGRFDELFFVDLPNDQERSQIIEIFAKRNLHRDVDEALMGRLVELSDGFAGSDIESAVYEVAKYAVLHGDDAVTDETFEASFRNIVPLSKTSPEQIEWIRTWGRERAVPASGRPISEDHEVGRTILV